MIKRLRRFPQRGGNIVAALAQIAGCQSGIMLAAGAILARDIGKRAAMAAETGDHQLGVIDLRAQPRGDGVAITARQCRRDMRGQPLANG